MISIFFNLQLISRFQPKTSQAWGGSGFFIVSGTERFGEAEEFRQLRWEGEFVGLALLRQRGKAIR